jgi:hypothetical protein
MIKPFAVGILLSASAASAQEAAPAPATTPVQVSAQPAVAVTAQPQLVVAAPMAPADHAGAIVVPKDTMVRLMVLNEVNTHDAKPGSHFVLRVDENVTVNGAVVIPVGAKAYGEVTNVKGNAALGKSGEIGARLLYVETAGEQLALTGEEQSKGNKGGGSLAWSVGTFGLMGLFSKGAPGKLKAGFIFNGYVAHDRLFDPATGKFIPDAADQSSPEAAAPAQAQ